MTPFAQTQVAGSRPDSINQVQLPKRSAYHPSPDDWRDQIVYFLLPDRFSDGGEAGRPMLDASAGWTRSNPKLAGHFAPRWDQWEESGQKHFQGGTLKGMESKLDYLKSLGVSTIWLGPVLKQRAHAGTYHGYAIQDFLEVEPRFGTRKDLAELVQAAHDRGMWVILDVIINHTGCNWLYMGDKFSMPYLRWAQHYSMGRWRDAQGAATNTAPGDWGPDEGVWPRELHDESCYTRAGTGSLDHNSVPEGERDWEHAEFRRSDFPDAVYGDLRDVNVDEARVVGFMSRCIAYWIALADIDGCRIDTVKHMPMQAARDFCGQVKEYAENLGKKDFYLVGEVAGGDDLAEQYQNGLKRNLNATLDIGNSRVQMVNVAKGLAPQSAYFEIIENWPADLGSHRFSAYYHMNVSEDHDAVCGTKSRISSRAAVVHQTAAAAAIQFFSLGIPCIYYGMEQSLPGPDDGEARQYLRDYNNGEPKTDTYLREAMFGPSAAVGAPGLPGFGPYGTCGAHCFNPKAPAYVRIAALAQARTDLPAARYGRQYQREVCYPGENAFRAPRAGEVAVWSRLLAEEEVLCVVNPNGTKAQNNVLVTVGQEWNNMGAPGSPWGAGGTPQFGVIANTAEAAAKAAGTAYGGRHAAGTRVPVKSVRGVLCVEIESLGPAESLILVNR